MAETTHPEILHVGPSDPARTPIADYARTFRDGVGQSKGLMITPLLSSDAPEEIEGDEDSIRLVKRRTAAALRQCGAVAGQVIHAELGKTTLREYWAAYYASRLRPYTPLCLVFHNPPSLPDSPLPPRLDARSGFLEHVLTRITDGLAVAARGRMAAHFLNRASVLLALSWRGAELLAQQYPFHRRKIGFLPPLPVGPILDDIEPNVRKPTETIQATLFGFLRPERGITDALLALQRLQKISPLAGRMHLRICGRMSSDKASDDFRRHVEEMIQKMALGRLVTFSPGALSEQALNQLLTETDILLLPYRKGGCEGVSMALLRAETWGVAPIASDTGGLSKLIEDGKDGQLFPVGNIEGLANAILQLVRDQDLRIRLARARRERALRERSSGQICSLLLPLYREMLRARDECRPALFPKGMIVPGIVPEQRLKTLEAGELEHA